MTTQITNDLNKIACGVIKPGCNYDDIDNEISHAFYDRSSTCDETKVEIFFDDLDSKLVELINSHDVIVGCVAWLTNWRILEALAANNKTVSILIQKEDFLRTDTIWSKQDLMLGYQSIPEQCLGYGLPEIGAVSYLSLPYDSVDAIRCVGVLNKTKNGISPRLHHKFLCFFNRSDIMYDSEYCFRCNFKVWTGSFNMTNNATHSLENGVLIHSEEITKAYLREWARCFRLSESLDWNSEWVEPDFRLGT
jgi:phosphatidylserine/phosphatidylglycerophosphate/cardiolipin synthase-like enzyme